MGSQMADTCDQGCEVVAIGLMLGIVSATPCNTSNPTPVMYPHRAADDSLPYAGNHDDCSAAGVFGLKRPSALNVPETSGGALSEYVCSGAR